MKRFLSTLLATSVVLTVGLTGCSSKTKDASSQSTAPITINFVDGLTGGDGGYMDKITEAFNKSQSKYIIKELHDKDPYTKFKTGGYDLVVVHGPDITTWMKDGIIQDITKVYSDAGIKIDDFYKVGQDAVTIDGKQYALPLDIHPLEMFYNKKLVQEAPKTYNDIVALNTKLQAQDKNTYALCIPATGVSPDYIMDLAVQNDIDLVNGDHLDFTKDAFVDTLLQWNKMIFQDKVSPANLGLDEEFKTFVQDGSSKSTAKSALSITGVWYYGALSQKFGSDLGIAPVPVIGKHAGAFGDTHNIAVSSNVKDSAKLAGISEYFKFMMKPENLIHWAEAGQAPLNKATADVVLKNPDKYPCPVINAQQFDTLKAAPHLYNYGNQTTYLNSNVFPMVVSTPNLTKEKLMTELKKATDVAAQAAKGNN